MTHLRLILVLATTFILLIASSANASEFEIQCRDSSQTWESREAICSHALKSGEVAQSVLTKRLLLQSVESYRAEKFAAAAADITLVALMFPRDQLSSTGASLLFTFRGNTLFNLRKYEAADGDYLFATIKEPSHGAPNFNRILSILKRGNLEKSIFEMRRGVGLLSGVNASLEHELQAAIQQLRANGYCQRVRECYSGRGFASQLEECIRNHCSLSVISVHDELVELATSLK